LSFRIFFISRIYFDLPYPSKKAFLLVDYSPIFSLCRTLVSPSNPGQISGACQVACRQSGVLQRLEDILLASGIPADVLTETINTLGRGQHSISYGLATKHRCRTPIYRQPLLIPPIENDGRIFAFCIPADVLTETINTLGRGRHTSAMVLPQSIDVEHLTIDDLS
jgi:hypothetical protein